MDPNTPVPTTGRTIPSPAHHFLLNQTVAVPGANKTRRILQGAIDPPILAGMILEDMHIEAEHTLHGIQGASDIGSQLFALKLKVLAWDDNLYWFACGISHLKILIDIWACILHAYGFALTLGNTEILAGTHLKYQ